MSIENTSVIIFLYLSEHSWMLFLGDNLHISVQIVGSHIEIADPNVRKELARFTNMFVQKYVIREVAGLSPTQVKLIKDNYNRMAHKWQVDTEKTKIAATREVMSELFPDLQPKSSRTDTTDATNKSLTTQTSSATASLNEQG